MPSETQLLLDFRIVRHIAWPKGRVYVRVDVIGIAVNVILSRIEPSLAEG